MRHPRPLTAGLTALLLGGGLLGWHAYLDRTGYRPPAVSLSHDECRGALADPGVAELLGRTPRVFANTRYLAPQPDSRPVLDCDVTGQGGRTLFASVTDGAGGISGDGIGVAVFGCTLNGRTEPYQAVLRLTEDGVRPAGGPGRERMGELVTGFAERAAATFGCAGGAGSLTVR
ncbi:hypothetical protein ACFYUY_29505 [Kitasatospora sp. NPDC004745]|uniref:hypothetical protein n=1 Tax=unclassified Kitasatospora TaxID=2633591 RepID=UPI0033C1A0CE